MRIIYVILALLIMPVPGLAGQTEIPDDTVRVSGKAVVFFGPSQAEYLSMSDQEKNEINRLLYDFYHYREQVLSFLELNEINEVNTARSKISIELEGNKRIIYNRKDFGKVVGLIMTDGYHMPKIFLGAATDSQIIDMCYQYFKLE
ncbi:MAG: hypothetical protein P8075_05220 [Deltaproteobacteria bacterium]|jgi:hypothetical protein